MHTKYRMKKKLLSMNISVMMLLSKFQAENPQASKKPKEKENKQARKINQETEKESKK